MERFTALLKKIATACAIICTLYSIAMAEEIKLVGIITKVQVSGNQATVTLKDSKTERSVEVLVNDELTMEKFKDKRIVEGDEVRVKYDSDAANQSKLFRKTSGC